MSREGEWEIWFGAWLSTIILAPIGLFFTFQSNRDSEIFNADSMKAFFKRLFAIPEKRNVTLKEVVIDDPDYNKDYETLKELYNEAHSYRKENRLKRVPSIRKIFFNEKDHTLDDLNEKMEALVEELGNSKNKKVIIYLNEFPIMSPHATLSPFKRRWLNILSIIIFPVGLVLYFRSIKFRRRLSKDLVKIEKTSRKLIEIFEKEKLINKENG